MSADWLYDSVRAEVEYRREDLAKAGRSSRVAHSRRARTRSRRQPRRSPIRDTQPSTGEILHGLWWR